VRGHPNQHHRNLSTLSTLSTSSRCSWAVALHHHHLPGRCFGRRVVHRLAS
jgi:hypothetical protein